MRLTGILSFLLTTCVHATTHYVDLNSANPASPYTDWSTAATNIQDAIAASTAGDTVLVTNGIYATGGISMDGTITNRVSLDKAITVQSVNGPWVTIIDGGSVTNNNSAIRGAWLTNGAALIGFTIQRGATRTVFSTLTGSGGGVWCYSSNCIVANCVLKGNMGYYYGGAVYQGNIQNCLISSNISFAQNAVSDATLNNCTITGNSGYGVAQNLGRLWATNCIIYFNQTGNNSGGTLNRCCTFPMVLGTGNFTNAPQLFADGVHLSSTSPCIGAGTTSATSADIFGRPWGIPPAVGCAEYDGAPIVTGGQIRFGDQPIGFSCRAAAQSQLPLTVWWLKDGSPLLDDGHYFATQTTNLVVGSTRVSDVGDYQLVVSNTLGVVTGAVCHLNVHCVNVAGVNPVSPYISWDTAATNIQDAIAAAVDGDIVLVTNGTYSLGGKSMDGVMVNRVAVDKAVAVQSVNGPLMTMISAGSVTNGTAAVRAVWLTNGAAVAGFTIQGGATRVSSTYLTGSGGGIWCSSSNAFVANCILISNMAYYVGSAVYQGSVQNCLILSNSAYFGTGGAAFSAILNGCTIIGNSYGIGQDVLVPSRITNCIVYSNPHGNWSAGTFSHCCTTPLPAGVGNFTNEPQLFVDGVHLTSNSPCIGAGAATSVNADLFGKTWANPPAIGCVEYDPSPVIMAPQIQLSGDPVGFVCQVAVQGQEPITYMWLKDGVPVEDDGHYVSSQTVSLMGIHANLSDAGSYQLVVSNAFGVVTSAVVQLTIHCVDVAGTNPSPPYTSWTTAATNIQDAISAAVDGEIVLVTNGIYASGGKSMDGTITNRVSIDKAILVQSVGGANATVIQGVWDATSTTGPGAVRCVWMTNNAILAGFTVTRGATRPYSNSGDPSMFGGGAWGSSTNAVVANCVLTANFASDYGGGAYRVKLTSCTIAGNNASGNGVTGTSIGNGGGAASCVAVNCLFSGNYAIGIGGGAASCMLTNCAFTKNQAMSVGSAAAGGTLVNCTLANNASVGAGSYSTGGAAANATLVNCIVYGNSSVGGSPTNYVSCSFTSSDSDPLPAGIGNIDLDPQLLADNIHVAATSPCIGAGTNSVVYGKDFDGQSWGSPPSIGCDEWHPEPVMAVQPGFQINPSTRGLKFTSVAAGQPPFDYLWFKDGVLIQEGNDSGAGSGTNLTIAHIDPSQAGNYQVVVSNTFGVSTSQIAPLVIHAVDANGNGPVSPYSSWATAATNIQDAIDSASAGEVVLVADGLYSTGGKVVAGDLTNRVALNKPITVISVNGYANTAIEGKWDSVSTNGPGAVRCAYVADGAMLAGFTLRNGATRSTGDAKTLQSGGAVYCNSPKGIVANCLLTNNCAVYGAGMAYGTLNNSLVSFNRASSYGSGACFATVQNCTIVNNFGSSALGIGTYGGAVLNSIVLYNYYGVYEYNHGVGDLYYYSCTSPLNGGVGNINGATLNPRFVDLYHISATSPCVGAGSALYSTGGDIDGEPWANPPSMGCDEVIVSNLTGALSVGVRAYQTNWIVNHFVGMLGTISGRASRVQWSFGDGTVITNMGFQMSHAWTNSGDYPVIFTAYNYDNPAGISANLTMHVQSLSVPQLQGAGWVTSGFQFQFGGQSNANYVVQYATNLAAPSWQTLQNLYVSTGQVYSITDTAGTNGVRFYRVIAQ